MNSGEYKPRVGLSDLYIAEITQDDVNGYVAGTPEWLAPAAEASLEPSVNSETIYADDQPYDTISQEGDTVINLEVMGIPLEMLAKVMGRVFDASSGRMFDNAGVPPYFALMFRSKKSNGSYRYFSFLKVRFQMPSEEMTTQTDSPDPKKTKLVATAVKTAYKFDLDGGTTIDSVKRVVGDEDTTNFSGTSWFSQVQTPSTTAPSALALSSSVPTDGATGVAVGADLTLTFNNALQDAAIYGVTLLKASDGSVVAGSNSLNVPKLVMTVNPTSDLDASTDYILVYAVTDIYGQTLNGAVNFTTA